MLKENKEFEVPEAKGKKKSICRSKGVSNSAALNSQFNAH